MMVSCVPMNLVSRSCNPRYTGEEFAIAILVCWVLGTGYKERKVPRS
jgi:hypothetical protein